VTTVVERRQAKLPSALTTPLRDIAYIFGSCRQQHTPPKFRNIYLIAFPIKADQGGPGVPTPQGLKLVRGINRKVRAD
jgi:hypothetical protein